MSSIATLDVPYGYVWAQLFTVVGDTTDDTDDKPDSVAAVGTVTFIPVKPIITSSVNGHGVIGIIQRYPYPIDSDGIVRDKAGNAPIAFMCGDYSVLFNLDGATLNAITITITTAHTSAEPLDLAEEYKRQTQGI